MSRARYWLTRSAEEDLSQIALYTLETWGDEPLEKYRLSLEHRRKVLLDIPELGRKHPRLRSDVSYVVEGKHYIFYRQVGGDIEVLRFLHCRCDILEKLSAYL